MDLRRGTLKCLVIGCIYRSPSSTVENDDLLNELINIAFSHITVR